MRDAHELARQPRRVDLLERKAQHEAVASVFRAERQPQRRDIELPAEMFERPVVLRNGSDTKGGETRFRAKFGHDLFDRAEAARRGMLRVYED